MGRPLNHAGRTNLRDKASSWSGALPPPYEREALPIVDKQLERAGCASQCYLMMLSRMRLKAHQVLSYAALSSS